MELISSMVSGLLVAGAAAVGKQVGGLAVKDAYEALKKIVIECFGRPNVVVAVEEDPSSDALNAALKEALTKAEAAQKPNAATKAEIVEKAKSLSRALQEVPQRELGTVGLLIENLRAVNARLDRIDVAGSGTGAVIENSTFNGDLNVGPINVKGKGADPN